MVRTPRLVAAMTAVMILLAACGSSGPTEGGGGMVDAEAAQSEADRAMKDVPIPPGASFAVTITDTSGSYEIGYGRAAVEGQAMCEWYRFWLRAIAAESTADVELAAQTVAEFPTWDTYQNADVSYTDLVDSIYESATLGDPGPMTNFVTANC
jgi:hypothetical protein